LELTWIFVQRHWSQRGRILSVALAKFGATAYLSVVTTASDSHASLHGDSQAALCGAKSNELHLD
jgi:hypothetical protein